MSTSNLSARKLSGHTLTVDWSRCAAHGVCAAALGEKIGLDHWGFPTGVTTGGIEVPEGLADAARLAVVSCPAAALRLHWTGRA
jgi:ferredoxin